jgi:hypothetical protein
MKYQIVIYKKIEYADGQEAFTATYHQDRIWKIIHEQLKKDEQYDDFMNCKKTDEIHKLIDLL